MPQGDLYQCAICKGVFHKGRSDAEAKAEFEQRHPHDGPIPEEEIDLICDDCFVEFDRWVKSLTPAQREAIERAWVP